MNRTFKHYSPISDDLNIILTSAAFGATATYLVGADAQFFFSIFTVILPILYFAVQSWLDGRFFENNACLLTNHLMGMLKDPNLWLFSEYGAIRSKDNSVDLQFESGGSCWNDNSLPYIGNWFSPCNAEICIVGDDGSIVMETSLNQADYLTSSQKRIITKQAYKAWKILKRREEQERLSRSLAQI